MKLQKQDRPLSKNPFIWLAALLLVILTLVVLENARVINFVKTIPAEGPTPAQKAEQKKTDEAKKQDFIEKAPEATPLAPPQDSSSITLTATQEANSVTILTKLKDFSGGSCELSITNSGKSYSATAEIIYQPEFSSCAGFSVPVAELGTGQWSITLNATPTGGSPLTKAATLEVK